MNFTPEIKTSRCSFSKGKHFVSWKSGLKFSISSDIFHIKSNFFIRKFLGCFSVKGKTIIVADAILGIVVFVLDKENVEQTLRIRTKNKINKNSVYFDEKSLRLFLGFDNKIIKISFPRIDKKITATIEKTLKITLNKTEFIDFILKESHNEYKGFWVKTNKNGLYFIEFKEATGNNQKNKLWRIRTYTKRSNFDIEQEEICFDIKSKNGFLFVATDKKIYRFCIISTRLSLVSSISFSSEIINNQLMFIKNYVLLIGINTLGSVIVRFNENNFVDNMTFWAFAMNEELVVDKAILSESSLMLSPKNIPGIVEIQKIIFDNHKVPYLAIDYNISHKILEEDEFIVSNFIETSKHFFFVAKNKTDFYIKTILKEDLSLAMSFPIADKRCDNTSLSFNGKDLYLLSEEELFIIHEKEF